MTESPEELAAVEQLLAEGDALRGWLARLELSPAASDTVRERVRNDYQKRLDQITAGLGAHADVVSAKLHADREEHAGLLARATDARDGLAEAELRHAVGEYDVDRFDGERQRFSGDIETYDVALGAVAERIGRLEQVHALVQRGPRPVEVDAPPAHAAPDPVDERPTIAIDDLAPDEQDALAVFDEPLGGGGALDHEAAPHYSSTPESTGPLSFRPSGEVARPTVAPPVARPRPFESAPPLGIPSADVPPRFVRPGERLGTHPAPPTSIPPLVEPPSAPGIVLRDDEEAASPMPEMTTTAPVGRTLRCGECGAMNRPLEWYCEKCGAELTAV